MRLSTITIAVDFQLLSRLRCPLILNDINKLNKKEENRLPNYHLIFSSSIISNHFSKIKGKHWRAIQFYYINTVKYIK